MDNGLDLYSLHASIGKVLDYLDVVDPRAGTRARSSSTTALRLLDPRGGPLE